MTNYYNRGRKVYARKRKMCGGGDLQQFQRRMILPFFFGFCFCISWATAAAQAASDAAQVAAPLIIDTTSLPPAHPRGAYSARLQQHGGTAPYHWKLEGGELPAGLTLTDDGTLHGTIQHAGEFKFTISVRDSGSPPQAVQRQYVFQVVTALSIQWKDQAHVDGNRIDGSVMVTNTTADDFDFTFVVLAVNEIGRATAIGYQHFPLKSGTQDFEIPFGDTLPHGAYTVHVDGVGENADKNEIHRARLQTPVPLQVTVGP